MPIDTLDEFASTGTKTEPSATQKARGWVGGEQVAGDQHNWWQNQITNKLNESIREGIDTVYPDSNAKNVIATQNWAVDGTSWGFANDTVNTISGGGSKAYVAIKTYYDGDDPRIIALHSAASANTLDIFDPRDPTATALDSSGTLLGLDTSGTTWVALDFCTDGTYVYVLFFDTADNDVVVQAYNISDWAVKTGWPASAGVGEAKGRIRIASELGLIAEPHYGKIIFANASYLAVSQPWNELGTTALAVAKIAISDGTVSTGLGNAPSSANDHAMCSIASDGTYLWFASYDFSASPTDYFLNSAQIGDLSTQACAPVNLGAAPVSAIFCPKPGVVIVFQNIAGTVPGGIGIYTSAGALTDAVSTSISLGRSNPISFVDVVYDGLNLWVLCNVTIDDDTTDDTALAVCRVPTAALMLQGVGADQSLLFEDAADFFIINPTEAAAGDAFMTHLPSIAFDGRDIWATVDVNAAGSLAGKIYRLPRANNR